MLTSGAFPTPLLGYFPMAVFFFVLVSRAAADACVPAAQIASHSAREAWLVRARAASAMTASSFDERIA